MKRKVTRIVLAIFVLSIALAFSQVTISAQTGGTYDLTWSSLDGGGAMPAGSTGGTYSLGGTIGQADAGPLTGGNYQLSGGFWLALVSALPSSNFNLYLPIILK